MRDLNLYGLCISSFSEKRKAMLAVGCRGKQLTKTWGIKSPSEMTQLIGKLTRVIDDR